MFLFAFSSYVNHEPVYYAIKADLTIYRSHDWKEFYSVTNMYCDKSLRLFCNGEYKADPDNEIHYHERFKGLFVISGDYEKIIILDQNKDIDYYQD